VSLGFRRAGGRALAHVMLDGQKLKGRVLSVVFAPPLVSSIEVL